jgi:hypothetical protein
LRCTEQHVAEEEEGENRIVAASTGRPEATHFQEAATGQDELKVEVDDEALQDDGSLGRRVLRHHGIELRSDCAAFEGDPQGRLPVHTLLNFTTRRIEVVIVRVRLVGIGLDALRARSAMLT